MTQVIRADELTADYGESDSRRIRQHIFSDLSILAGDLALHYVRTAGRTSYEQANQALINIHQELCIEDLNLCADDRELDQAAVRLAEKCRRASDSAGSPEQAYEACTRIAHRFQIEPPAIKADDPQPALKRMAARYWWKRKIHILRTRKIETIARNLELVNRLRDVYASDYTIQTHRKKKEKNRQYLTTTFMQNEEGQQFSLQELADRSVSNPAIRRAELMVRMRGFGMVANFLGHAGEFYTLTAPSRMHASLHSGAANPHYDGTTVLQAHEYLTHLWTLIRAELGRRGIHPYGFRVVEPHHDGTPHWHLMLFMPESHSQSAREVMQHYALQWKNVDLEQNRIFVTCAFVRGQMKETKTRSGKREIPLQPQAREALLDQIRFTKESGFVFHDPLTNAPWKSDQPIRKRVWIPALKRAGVKYREPYQTRHTFASTLLSRGGNPLRVAQLMGHKDWGQIIQIYGRYIPIEKDCISPIMGLILPG